MISFVFILTNIPILSFVMNQSTTDSEMTPWDAIYDFLRPILDPLFSVWENYDLRVTLLSTIIWSFMIICGLVFLVFEGPTLLPIIFGKEYKPPRRPTPVQKEQPTSTRTVTSYGSASALERKKEESKTQSTDDLGVRVISKIKKHHDTLLLKVNVSNVSDSKIDMVVVDLDLPQGIDTDIGFFRMQRIGSIESGHTESVEFSLKSMGGRPELIGGHVEFLGASYEASKVPIPAPEMED